MKDQELLKCPLPKAANVVRGADPLGLMNDDKLQERVEICVAGAPRSSDGVQKTGSVVNKSPEKRDFQKDVHTWNTKLSLWRRSAKE